MKYLTHVAGFALLAFMHAGATRANAEVASATRTEETPELMEPMDVDIRAAEYDLQHWPNASVPGVRLAQIAVGPAGECLEADGFSRPKIDDRLEMRFDLTGRHRAPKRLFDARHPLGGFLHFMRVDDDCLTRRARVGRSLLTPGSPILCRSILRVWPTTTGPRRR